MGFFYSGIVNPGSNIAFDVVGGTMNSTIFGTRYVWQSNRIPFYQVTVQVLLEVGDIIGVTVRPSLDLNISLLFADASYPNLLNITLVKRVPLL